MLYPPGKDNWTRKTQKCKFFAKKAKEMLLHRKTNLLDAFHSVSFVSKLYNEGSEIDSSFYREKGKNNDARTR